LFIPIIAAGELSPAQQAMLGEVYAACMGRPLNGNRIRR